MVTTPDNAGIRNWYEQPSVSVDLDNTIFAGNSGDGFGPPIPAMVDFLWKLYGDGWYIVVTTSRPHGWFPDIRDALDAANVPYHQIVTGGKPTVDLYIDDLGLLPPLHALDALLYRRRPETGQSAWDREQAQVPENPAYADAAIAYDDPDFRVIVAFTGGLDSLTMAEMAHREGLPVALAYVDVGQDYAEAEFATAARFGRERYGKPVAALVGPKLDAKWKHILPGRNAAILDAIGAWAARQMWWGEVWFGNLGGESPQIGGDKSSRFLLTAQHLFTMGGIDLRIASPLRGLDKPDLVRMWYGWAERHVLDGVKSCFHPSLPRCGTCQTCARTLLAYEAVEAGSWHHLFDPHSVGSDMDAHFAKYATAMPAYVRGKDSRYSPRRATDTLAALGRLIDRGEWKGLA